jgi:hypothetical protein
MRSGDVYPEQNGLYRKWECVASLPMSRPKACDPERRDEVGQFQIDIDRDKIAHCVERELAPGSGEGVAEFSCSRILFS